MTWHIEYRPNVIKDDIPALSKTARLQIQKAIEQRLTTEPQLYGKPLRFNFSGLRRLRVGNYRIIYCIDPKSETVIVTAIGHHKDIYED